MPPPAQPSLPEEQPSNIVPMPEGGEDAAESSRFSRPENFINRELSWIEFNRRVLEEAQDPTQPLIERVKFLTIVSSNLDEFFEIRVAGIKQQIESETSDVGPDGLTPTDTFNAIQRVVHEMVATQYALWRDELVPLLAKHGIRIHHVAQLSTKRGAWARRYFQQEVFPMLTPLAVDASHPFPQLLNKSHNLLVRARAEKGGEPLHAIVQVPRVLPRLIQMPRGKGDDEPWEYIYLAALIKHNIADLFPGLILDGVHAFRVTRNSDLYIDDEEPITCSAASSRSSAAPAAVTPCGSKSKPIVRAISASNSRLFQSYGAGSVSRRRPLTMTHLAPLVANDAFANLKDRVFKPARDPALPPHANIFDVMRKQDVLLHHPYESFDPIVELIESAAEDPHVLALKITLYRTSGDSSIVAALIDAANAGKQVTALVELRARFDEAANIQWARRLEEAGAHVVYGVVGLKTHCKALLIVRRDSDKLRHYVHLGTATITRAPRAFTRTSAC
jgi:polyphosphate kinase